MLNLFTGPAASGPAGLAHLSDLAATFLPEARAHTATLLASATVAPVAVSNPWVILLRFLVGIVVVFALMWFVWQRFKKSSLSNFEGPGIRVVARLGLSRASQVVLVEVSGRMFLLGAGDSSVTPIAEIFDAEGLNDTLGEGFNGSLEGLGRDLNRDLNPELAGNPAGTSARNLTGAAPGSTNFSESKLQELAKQFGAKYGKTGV